MPQEGVVILGIWCFCRRHRHRICQSDLMTKPPGSSVARHTGSLARVKRFVGVAAVLELVDSSVDLTDTMVEPGAAEDLMLSRVRGQ